MRKARMMIFLMVIVVLFCIVTVAQDYDFIAERLTDDEVRLDAESSKEFAAAQVKRLAVVNKIKAAHGDNRGITRWLPCGATVTEVELRGKFALITRTKNYSSCPVAAGGK